MFANIVQNNGLNIAVSGLIVVFLGLILISLAIYAFNLFFAWRSRCHQEGGAAAAPAAARSSRKAIPVEHLAAIAAAVEVYRRLHFDELSSEITFAKGNAQSDWKLGHRYGQRFFSARNR